MTPPELVDYVVDSLNDCRGWKFTGKYLCNGLNRCRPPKAPRLELSDVVVAAEQAVAQGRISATGSRSGRQYHALEAAPESTSASNRDAKAKAK